MSDPVKHCFDNARDRGEGALWERKFAELALAWGRTFTAHQWHTSGRSAVAHKWHGKPWTLPDVTIWTAPGEHHEIKHKSPCRRWKFGVHRQCYGLEVYRFEALLNFRFETRTPTFYTIHDWQLAEQKGRPRKPANGSPSVNHVDDWVTIEVLRLEQLVQDGVAELSKVSSWVNGAKRDNIPIYYWPVDQWLPLEHVWGRSFVATTIKDRYRHRALQDPVSTRDAWWDVLS